MKVCTIIVIIIIVVVVIIIIVVIVIVIVIIIVIAIVIVQVLLGVFSGGGYTLATAPLAYEKASTSASTLSRTSRMPAAMSEPSKIQNSGATTRLTSRSSTTNTIVTRIVNE